jgi:hypothetical protein
MGLVVLVKKMSVLINFLLQTTNLVSVLSKICPNFADRTDTFRELCTYHFSFFHAMTKFKDIDKKKSQSQKRYNERKYQYLKYKKKTHSGPDT